MYLERSFSVLTNLGLALYASLCNSHRNSIPSPSALHMYPAFNGVYARLAQVNVILVDKRLRYSDQRNPPCQPAIVPPVRLRRRRSIFMPRVIYDGNDEVTPSLQR